MGAVEVLEAAEAHLLNESGHKHHRIVGLIDVACDHLLLEQRLAGSTTQAGPIHSAVVAHPG